VGTTFVKPVEDQNDRRSRSGQMAGQMVALQCHQILFKAGDLLLCTTKASFPVGAFSASMFSGEQNINKAQQCSFTVSSKFGMLSVAQEPQFVFLST